MLIPFSFVGPYQTTKQCLVIAGRRVNWAESHTVAAAPIRNVVETLHPLPSAGTTLHKQQIIARMFYGDKVNQLGEFRKKARLVTYCALAIAVVFALIAGGFSNRLRSVVAVDNARAIIESYHGKRPLIRLTL